MHAARTARWLGLATSFAGFAAHAQAGADFAARRDLLAQAQAAQAANDHPRALELATRAGQLQMTPSVRMFIAQEELVLGRAAEALNDAELCVREAQNPTVSNHEAIRLACVDTVNQARGRVGRVVIRPPNVPDVVIRVNDREVPSALLGVPYIVSPGSVSVETAAPGHVPSRVAVQVASGSTVDVAATVGAEIVGSSPPPSRPAFVARSAPGVDAPPDDGQRRNGVPVPPIVVLGVGVLGLGAGVVAGVIQSGDASRLAHDCPMGSELMCTTPDQSLYAEARAATTTANTAFIAGGVLAAAGGVWLVVDLLTRHSSGTHRASAEMLPTWSAQGPGLVFDARF